MRVSEKKTNHIAPDGRHFIVQEFNCLHSACFGARCECGVVITKHDFDPHGALRSALEALTRPGQFGHTCRSTKETAA